MELKIEILLNVTPRYLVVRTLYYANFIRLNCAKSEETIICLVCDIDCFEDQIK
jgi:hypothetical protein